MANVFDIVVCAGLVPDRCKPWNRSPAQAPGSRTKWSARGPRPWAASALYEAANLAQKNPGSKVWLVSLGPKAKLQQVMMTVARR